MSENKELNEGWKANAALEPLKACPYPYGSPEAKKWCKGWYEANNDPTLLSEKSATHYPHPY